MKKVLKNPYLFTAIIIAFAFPSFSYAQLTPVSIYPNPAVSLNYPLQDNTQYTDFNGDLYFIATAFTHHDWELWKTNGNLNGTAKIKALQSGTASCNTTPELIATNSKLFFKASDPSAGEELWTSDGTVNGTMLLKDINPGLATSCLGAFTVKGDTLFFVADDGVNGSELWMSDGTPAGTKMVLNINSVPVSGNGLDKSDQMIVVNGILYFAANNFFNGKELWRSDGSAAGTYMVKDINTGPPSSMYLYFFKVGNRFYFTSSDNTNGIEPWVSDGTTSGTYIVKDINPGTAYSNPNFLNSIGDSLVYFAANDGLYGTEFWRSNGTVSGTYMLKDFNIGPGNGNFSELFKFNNDYYITAEINNTNRYFYKTDYLLNTFTLIKNIDAKLGWGIACHCGYAKQYGNKFYFAGNDGFFGNELWGSDGTTSGTTLVKDIEPNGSSDPMSIIISNSKLYFNAYQSAISNSGSLFKLDTCQLIAITGTTDSITGSININVTGGNLPYFKYVWSNGGSTQNVSGLSQGSYTVTVYDNSGCSMSKTFVLNTTIGIKENFFKDRLINIYPNPFSTQTTLHSTFPLNNATLIIENYLGQTMAQIENINEQTITFYRNNFQCGLYFIKLMQGNKTIAIDKIVISEK